MAILAGFERMEQNSHRYKKHNTPNVIFFQ
jgi:hypothetical protein